MTPLTVLDITQKGLLLVLFITLPIVAVATLTALVVGVLQAVTQIQDQSIGQSIRIIAVMVSLVLMGGWLGREVVHFAEQAFKTVSLVP